MKLYDIGKELFSAPVYPGDPIPSKEPVLEIEKGDLCNLTKLTLGSHSGTHIDAPRHFCRDGEGVEAVPLEKCMGVCKVARVRGNIGEREALKLLEDGTKRLLLQGEIILTKDGARVMAEKGIFLIGVEGQTVGQGEEQEQVHKILLGSRAVILEGLVLKEIDPGEYFLAAQPLKLSGVDGSPVRPVLIKEER